MLRNCLPTLHFLLRMPRRASLGFGSPCGPALLLGLRLGLLSPLGLFLLSPCRPGLSFTGSALLLGLRLGLLSPLGLFLLSPCRPGLSLTGPALLLGLRLGLLSLLCPLCLLLRQGGLR